MAEKSVEITGLPRTIASATRRPSSLAAVQRDDCVASRDQAEHVIPRQGLLDQDNVGIVHQHLMKGPAFFGYLFRVNRLNDQSGGGRPVSVTKAPFEGA